MQPVMSRLATVLAITGLALALLVACGGDTTTPTATQAPMPTGAPTSPSVTAEPAATQTPAPTLAPTPTRPTAEPTATATQTPATAALPLDEYLFVCALTEELNLDDDATYGTLSAAMGALVEGMSPLAPPSEVADWHNKSLEIAKGLKGLVDSQPDDKVIGIEFFAIATELQGPQEALTLAENALPADIRQQMTDAGCIDPEPSSGSGTEPDDHGNGIDTATTVAVEETVQGSLDLYDWDAFAVQVKEGQNYEARLSNYSFGAIGSKEGSLLTVFDSAGREVASLDEDSVRKVVEWTAGDAGSYYVVLGDGATQGDYTLTVTSAPEPTTEVPREVIPTPAAPQPAIPTPDAPKPATPAPAATPTPAGSDREDINLTYLCAREGSRSCVAMQEFFDEVRARTGGLVNFEPSHFVELGGIQEQAVLIATLRTGQLDFGEIVAGDVFPYPNAVSLWETFATPDDYSGISDELAAEMIRLVGQEGEDLDLKVVGITFNNDLNLFSKQPISSLADFEGLRFRSPGGPVFDLLYAVLGQWGAELQYMPLQATYSALADGNLDVVATCGLCAANSELYEVADHATGPIPGFRPQSLLVLDGWAWDNLPEDIQAIIAEEGRAHTQRQLANAGERDAAGLQELTGRGMSFAELPPDVLAEVRNLVASSADVYAESAHALGLR